MQMAGFTDWLKENAIMAFLPVAIFASMVVEADPVSFILALLIIFGVSFLIVSGVRLILLGLER